MPRLTLIAALLAAAVAVPAAAQDAPRSIVSTYRAVSGQQVELLKWFARQDEVAKAAGVPTAQLYVHQQGASWDFVQILPETTAAQDKAVDAAAAKMGYPAGPAAGLELRKYIAEHTDTLSVGPTNAAAWLKVLGK